MAVSRRLSHNTSFREETLSSTPQSLTVEAIKLHTGFTKIACLELCPNLVNLDLSNNKISRMEGLASLVNLQVLCLASNCISTVENVLNMQGNQIETIAAINIPLLAQLPALTTLCFQNIDLTASNPACQSSGYRASILQHLPSLRNLDGERSPGSQQYICISATIDSIRAQPPLNLEEHVPLVPPLLPELVQQPTCTAEQPAALERAGWESKVLAAVDKCVMLSVVLNEKLHRQSQG